MPVKNLKIGQYLAKIWTQICSLLFWFTLYMLSLVRLNGWSQAANNWQPPTIVTARTVESTSAADDSCSLSRAVLSVLHARSPQIWREIQPKSLVWWRSIHAVLSYRDRHKWQAQRQWRLRHTAAALHSLTARVQPSHVIISCQCFQSGGWQTGMSRLFFFVWS